jgi:hypothetical protein
MTGAFPKAPVRFTAGQLGIALGCLADKASIR